MNSNNNEYILFYSDKCMHSQELITLLKKDVDLYQRFIKINVGTRGVKIPNFVQSVPTAIIPIGGKAKVLVGSNIFNWYNDTHKVTIENNSILDFDPMGMTGFSDSFSFINENSNSQPLKKSYAFITDNITINAPDENAFEGSKSEADVKNKKKSDAERAYEAMVSQRKLEVPRPLQRM